MKKFLFAAVCTMTLVGYVIADEFTAVITKVDGKNISYFKTEAGKGGKGGGGKKGGGTRRSAMSKRPLPPIASRCPRACSMPTPKPRKPATLLKAA